MVLDKFREYGLNLINDINLLEQIIFCSNINLKEILKQKLPEPKYLIFCSLLNESNLLELLDFFDDENIKAKIIIASNANNECIYKDLQEISDPFLKRKISLSVLEDISCLKRSIIQIDTYATIKEKILKCKNDFKKIKILKELKLHFPNLDTNVMKLSLLRYISNDLNNTMELDTLNI